jgi:hypothetical protein
MYTYINLPHGETLGTQRQALCQQSLIDCKMTRTSAPYVATIYDVATAEATLHVCIELIEPANKPQTVVETYRSYPPEYSCETERKLLRKIDTRLLPLVVVIYLFNYLNRNSITQARLYGLQEDTHITGAVYQTAISIFSAGYIVMQSPSTILTTKFQPSIFLVSTAIHLPLLLRVLHLIAILHHCLGSCEWLHKRHKLTIRSTHGPFLPGHH